MARHPLPLDPRTGDHEPGLVFQVCGSRRDGQTVRIRSPKCTIGSDSRCTLRLGCRTVRPVHCLIVRGHDRVVVRRWSPDTRLNGRAFRDAVLQSGDLLTIGGIELEVVETGAEADEADKTPAASSVTVLDPSCQPEARSQQPDRPALQQLRTRLDLANRQGRRRARLLIEELRAARQQIAVAEQARAEAERALRDAARDGIARGAGRPPKAELPSGSDTIPMDPRAVRAGAMASLPADGEHANGDEESIDEYMSRLMKRVHTAEGAAAPTGASSSASSGGDNQAQAPPADGSVISPVVDAVPAAGPAPPVAPRAVAPEKETGLSAMRELANLSTQAALDRHVRAKLVRAQRIRLIGMLGGLCAGGLLMVMCAVGISGSWALYAALIGLFVGGLWGVPYAVLAVHWLAKALAATRKSHRRVR